MTVRARVWTWVTDWRNGVTLAASLFMVVVLLVVFDAVDGRRDAFEALERQTEQLADSRRAATRRIDLLQRQIDELIGTGQSNAREIGALVVEVEALRAQVRMLGGTPIVAVVVPTTSTSGQPQRPTVTTGAAPTTAQPTSTTTTTTAPPPGDEPRPATPIPFPCQTLFFPILCTEGASP